MRQVAFIRAVMIGREGLHQEVVLDIFSRAGAGSPVSHRATGNVSFDLEPAAMIPFLEETDHRMTEVVGRPIESFVRTLDELSSIDGAAIFSLAPFEVVEGRHVTFFHETPDLGDWSLPHLARHDRVAVFHVSDREVFSASQVVDGESAAPGGILEKATGQRATTRAWSTIHHILSKH